MGLRALYTVEPWGPERDNMHFAQLLAQNANLHRRPNTPPIHPRVYMYGYTRQEHNERKVSQLRAVIRSQKKQVH